MAVLPILQDGEPRLRAVSKPVPKELFGTPELAGMISDMTETLDKEQDGVAIAAPQVGILYRIFLVRYDRIAPAPKEGEPPRPASVGVFINPHLKKLSKKSEEMDEGCLSVRRIYGKIKRKTRATVRAVDADGTAFERGGGGVLAEAFQHEIDHLDGILFIDKAHDLREMTADERRELRESRAQKAELATNDAE